VAEAVRRAFSEAAAEVDGWPVGATLSVGVVHHQGAALDLSELLLQADQALYGAKQCGRNCVEFARIDTLRRRREPAPCIVAAEVARNAA
jgi:GGDEF domain-containing protein